MGHLIILVYVIGVPHGARDKLMANVEIRWPILNSEIVWIKDVINIRERR